MGKVRGRGKGFFFLQAGGNWPWMTLWLIFISFSASSPSFLAVYRCCLKVRGRRIQNKTSLTAIFNVLFGCFIRPLRHFNHSGAGSFHDCLTNLQRFHQQLQGSNEYYRTSTLPGLQRLRRRRQPIITDGPVVTVRDLMLRSPEIIDASTPDQTHDDSVTFVSEVCFFNLW